MERSKVKNSFCLVILFFTGQNCSFLLSMHCSANHCPQFSTQKGYYQLLLRKYTVCLVLYRIQLLTVLDLLKKRHCVSAGGYVHTCWCTYTHTPSIFLAFSFRGIAKKVQPKRLPKTLMETVKETTQDPNTCPRALSHLLIATCSQACLASHVYFTASLLELLN